MCPIWCETQMTRFLFRVAELSLSLLPALRTNNNPLIFQFAARLSINTARVTQIWKSLDADLQIGLGADPEVYTQIRQYCLYFEVAAVLHQLRLEGTRDLRNGVDVESSHGFEGESDGVRMVNIDDRSCIGFVTLSGKACSFDPPNEMDMGGRGESSGTGRCSADPTTSSSSLLLLRPR
ncbi:hypothetical protein BLNAU_13858 [Blattamonas nauphoetae]|uniref:Uncharacterized protein n=1 Tax=Blattamonas nauphoetae TaxID=2049346 RepID=A0ABQ9XIN5_9EUKA|nr:hypothetical protein BLNAU_13858 [Blattamonas nauphoetae]